MKAVDFYADAKFCLYFFSLIFIWDQNSRIIKQSKIKLSKRYYMPKSYLRGYMREFFCLLPVLLNFSRGIYYGKASILKTDKFLAEYLWIGKYSYKTIIQTVTEIILVTFRLQ